MDYKKNWFGHFNWFGLPLQDLIKKEDLPKIIVETGSYMGEGISLYSRMDAFDEIHSIEIMEKWYNYNVEKFKNRPYIHLHLGASHEVLKEKFLDKDEACLFYLDAHYSGGETGGLEIDNGCPVLRELEIVAKRNNEKDIIVVDDMRLMGFKKTGGTPGDTIYPLTEFDFRHATIENMMTAVKKYRDDSIGFFLGGDRMYIISASILK
jgi:hypothetical protein